MNNAEKVEIAKYIMAEPKRIIMAGKVAEAFDDVLWKFAVDFRSAIQRDIESSGYIADESDEKTDIIDWTYFGLRVKRKGWHDGCWVGLESQAKKLRRFIIGCQWNIKTRDKNESELRENLNKECGNGQRSADWIWYKNMDRDYINWSNSATLELLANDWANGGGEHVHNVANILREIGSIIDNVFKK